MMKRWTRVALCCVLTVPGCGYNLAGRGSFLPERIKTLGIPPFDSTVPRREVIEKLTREVTRAFISRGGYKVVPGSASADALLTGTITGLILTPIAFDNSGRATRARLSITAGVKLVDLRDQIVLYESPGFQFGSDVELTGDQDLFDPESTAIDPIARDFARSLVSTVVEGF